MEIFVCCRFFCSRVPMLTDNPCFRMSGYMMIDKLEVPHRRVKKNWYVGLDPDPVDRSHPDVHDDQLLLEAAEKKSESRKLLPSSKQFCNLLVLLFYLLRS